MDLECPIPLSPSPKSGLCNPCFYLLSLTLHTRVNFTIILFHCQYYFNFLHIEKNRRGEFTRGYGCTTLCADSTFWVAAICVKVSFPMAKKMNLVSIPVGKFE